MKKINLPAELSLQRREQHGVHASGSNRIQRNWAHRRAHTATADLRAIGRSLPSEVEHTGIELQPDASARLVRDHHTLGIALRGPSFWRA